MFKHPGDPSIPIKELLHMVPLTERGRRREWDIAFIFENGTVVQKMMTSFWVLFQMVKHLGPQRYEGNLVNYFFNFKF